MLDDDAMLTVELKNIKPVDLIDLTTSLMALAQSFQDYAIVQTGEPQEAMKLYVRDIRQGSIIADLVTAANQADFLVKNLDVLVGFVANIQDIANFFLGRDTAIEKPTTKQAKQISQIVEPVAKDNGSQMNIQVFDGGTVNVHHIHFGSMDSNAIQNGVSRFLGPSLPASYIATDQLLTLEQVKNSTKSKTGDRGVIETVIQKPVKLQFLSEDAKRQVLELQENPLQCVFLVDAEVRSVEGKPTLYRIISVKDVIHKE